MTSTSKEEPRLTKLKKSAALRDKVRRTLSNVQIASPTFFSAAGNNHF